MRERTALVMAGIMWCWWVAAGVCVGQPQNEVVILGGVEEKPVVTAKRMPTEAEIGLGGVLMLRIRASAVGYTPAERGRIVEARLVHALSYADLSPEAVRIVMVRSVPTIYVGPVRLISVYPADAAAAGARSPQKLAEVWAASVASCLRALAPWSRVAP